MMLLLLLLKRPVLLSRAFAVDIRDVVALDLEAFVDVFVVIVFVVFVVDVVEVIDVDAIVNPNCDIFTFSNS